MSSDNTAEIREALDNPQPAPQLAAPGDAPERKVRERPPLPAGCPVKPLGIQSTLDGKQTCYYLDVRGQLNGLEAAHRHGKNSLIALFGSKSDWLEEHFPQWSKPVYEGRGANRICVKESEIIGFDQAEASRALIEECDRKGIFDAVGKIRGRGAHRHNFVGLVLHCGDRILTSHHRADGSIKGWEWTEPGVHAGYVYQGEQAIPRPEGDPASDRAGVAPARELIKLLMTWNWRRPAVDVRLMLGGIGASFIGGALQWRSNIWITGGSGTGKSTLNGLDGLLHRLFGEGMFRTGNTSSAAIRQSLLNATIPVMIDEFEAKKDNRKVEEVIELARLASSGEKMHRGGQDHHAHEFTIQSCFWFSSINIPPLEQQDRNRLGILELMPFEDKPEQINWQKWKLPLRGRQLMQRMIDKWDLVDKVIAKYVDALADVGHDQRGAKQFGTLLGCGDILVHDHDTEDGLPDDEEIAAWVEMCRPEKMREVSQNEPDYVRCLDYLLDSQVQARGGDERVALSSWVGDTVKLAVDPLFNNTPAEGGEPQERVDQHAARRLQEIGLKVVNARLYPAERDGAGKVVKPARWGTTLYEKDDPGFLAIANTHKGLGALFEGEKWKGNWNESLRRTPGSIEAAKVKFGRRTSWAVLIPLYAVLDESELPNACQRGAAEEWMAEQMKGVEG